MLSMSLQLFCCGFVCLVVIDVSAIAEAPYSWGVQATQGYQISGFLSAPPDVPPNVSS